MVVMALCLSLCGMAEERSYEGTLSLGGTSLKLVFNFSTVQNAVKCTMDSPMQLDVPIPLVEQTEKGLKEVTPWLRYFLAMDPSVYVKATRCPVLALNGSKDTQVDAGSNLSRLRKLLPFREKNGVEEMPGLNHLMQHAKTGMVEEYYQIEETFAPEVLEKMVKFIGGL